MLPGFKGVYCTFGGNVASGNIAKSSACGDDGP
jgi:hypothetical protein